MTTVIINENQNGLLFKNGKYQKTVGAGKYRLFGGRTMEILEQGKIIDSKYCALDTLLAHPDFAKLVSTVEVGDEQIALHFVNGSFRCAIARPGKYAFRNGGDTHEFRMVDISAPEVPADFPRYILDRMQPSLYKTVEVAAYQKARLFFDNKFVRLLEPGTYAFWNGGVKVDVDFVDTRLLQMDITGQEIMTQDKVALRINFVCSYRITDYVRILTEIDNYVEQLHIAAQLALRDFVGKYRLDEILENKEGLSRFVACAPAGEGGVAFRGNQRRGCQGHHSPRRDPRDHEHGARRRKAGAGERHLPPRRSRVHAVAAQHGETDGGEPDAVQAQGAGIR